MPISSANFAVTAPNGLTPLPTAYTITSGDVAAGIVITPAMITGAASYGQPGFLPEHLRLVFTTTTAGANFTAVIDATQATTDVPNSAAPFPYANRGNVALPIGTVGAWVVDGLTSGWLMQPDGSIKISFTGTLGVTTLYGLVGPYAPAGPRG